MTPSPSDLHYFLESATSLNLSRAAERLGIAQPSLSLAIKRIETDLGEPVFVRSKRGVALTQAGKQLFLHTRHLLDAWSNIRSKAKASMKDIEGIYTIGCHPSVARYSLPNVLQKALADHPKLDIRLSHDLSRRVTESVVSSSIDLGIVVNPRPHPDLVITRLAHDDVAFWQADAKKSSRSRLNPVNSSILICDSNLVQTQLLMKKSAKHGFKPDRFIESSNLEVITELVAAGCGIGILPTRVALTASRPLKQLTDLPTYRDEICLVSRVENRQVAAIRYLCESIRNYFSTLTD